MAKSYESINYRLRPAKSIERKMLCESIKRMGVFGDLSSYRYIGFGSTYFSDFKLIHKTLGIHNMISLEKEDDLNRQKRFEFNKPFKCIQLRFGTSNDELPKLRNWDIRSILWLDYDGELDSSVLADIQFYFSEVCSGSMFLVSVNAHPQPANSTPSRLDKLKENVGDENIPFGTKEKDLSGWNKSLILKKIINEKIKKTLNERNAGRPKGSKLLYKQIFHFRYEDGAKMLTLGGVIIDEGQESIFQSCNFRQFEFFKDGDDPYTIKVPNLTFKELKFLDSMLPTENINDLFSICSGSGKSDVYIPNGDINSYNQIYRYFPAFVESDY